VTAPRITRIAFPSSIIADGRRIGGRVYFSEPNGDLTRAQFSVLQGTFTPFSLNVNARGLRSGSFTFKIWCKSVQHVTLRVTLMDAAGNRSAPRDFAFMCRSGGSAPPAGPVPPVSGFGMEHNVNRPGGDYRSFDLPQARPELCRDACWNDPRCRAYTYVRPGIQGAYARCWLKSVVPNPVQSTCCVSGVSSTIGGPGPTQSSLSAVWRGMTADVVGTWGSGRPNGQPDGHFTVTLNTGGARRVVRFIMLQLANAQGRPVGNEVWDTRPGGYWILGVYRNGRRLNPTDVDITDTVVGFARYELYGNAGSFRPGQYFRITVGFADGGEVVAVTRI
jgi:hypothetical protein